MASFFGGIGQTIQVRHSAPIFVAMTNPIGLATIGLGGGPSVLWYTPFNSQWALYLCLGTIGDYRRVHRCVCPIRLWYVPSLSEIATELT
jgi:hypothetical protein